MSKIVKILLVLVAVIGLMGIQSVYATPTLTLSDGTIVNTITITDGGVGDMLGDSGGITFIGSVGVFNINVTTGLTKPAIGSAILPNMDLNSLNVSKGAGILTITFFDDNFGPYTGGFTLNVGGTTNNSTASFELLINGTPVVDLGPFAGAFSGSANGGNGSYTNFSITEVATINAAGGSTTSFDAEVITPEPSTLLLLGSGLVGAAFYARRRKK